MKTLRFIILVSSLLVPMSLRAELPWQFDQHTRYMALGDSLGAGYGAIPATEGYVYLLYRSGVFDTIPHTLFNDAAVIGATSEQVLKYQVPQVGSFEPNVITLTVGGNDLFTIFEGADPGAVLDNFQNNLIQILGTLQNALPNAKIYISNLYTISEIPGADDIVPIINQIIGSVASFYGVPVADVFSAFGGFEGRKGLLLIERHGADPDQVHPTNAGYRVIAQAFEAVIDK
jgi:lysophospholipase L1-like esterase